MLAYITGQMHEIHEAKPKEGYTAAQEASLATLRRIAREIGDIRYQLVRQGRA